MKVGQLDFDFPFSDLIDSAEGNASTGWAQDFVADMRSKYAQYGDEMFISDAQLDKLRQIAKDD